VQPQRHRAVLEPAGTVTWPAGQNGAKSSPSRPGGPVPPCAARWTATG